ncbi:MAG: flavin reductase family protein [Phycisphaerae bacterium]|nr:flavin reductase family protein [Phycisphaerae bacterium]
MAKRDIPYTDYFTEVVKTMTGTGLLLVSKDGNDRPNAMTIGWGTIGAIWGKPMWVILVRPSRYTYQCIEKTGDFTINVPPPGLKEAVTFCGTKSGRDYDKFSTCKLTAVPGRAVNAPIIGECVVNYECRVVHHNDVLPSELVGAIQNSAYKDGDYHRVYFGEILEAYADEDAGRKLK